MPCRDHGVTYQAVGNLGFCRADEVPRRPASKTWTAAPGAGFERPELMSLALSRWVEDGTAVLVTGSTDYAT